MPGSYGTIGALIDGGYTVRVYCEAKGCNNMGVVDLPSLAERLGRDHGCLHDDLKPHFRCSKCGSKAVSFRLSPGAYDKTMFDRR